MILGILASQIAKAAILAVLELVLAAVESVEAITVVKTLATAIQYRFLSSNTDFGRNLQNSESSDISSTRNSFSSCGISGSGKSSENIDDRHSSDFLPVKKQKQKQKIAKASILAVLEVVLAAVESVAAITAVKPLPTATVAISKQ